MPVQVNPGQRLVIGAPHVTDAAVGHSGAHSQRVPLHVCPAGQSVPALGQGTPGHEPTTAAPHATVVGDGHESRHSHAPAALQR